MRHIQLAMRSHVSNDLVQRAACGAIANLALRYDDIRKQVVSDGVLRNVINAMSAHKVNKSSNSRNNIDDTNFT